MSLCNSTTTINDAVSLHATQCPQHVQSLAEKHFYALRKVQQHHLDTIPTECTEPQSHWRLPGSRDRMRVVSNSNTAE